MINTPPQERPPADQAPSSATQSQLTPSTHQSAVRRTVANVTTDLHDRRNYYRSGSSQPGTPRHVDEYITSSGGSLLGTASAAAALAELHGIKSEREFDMDRVCDPDAHHPTMTPRPIDSLDSNAPIPRRQRLTCAPALRIIIQILMDGASLALRLNCPPCNSPTTTLQAIQGRARFFRLSWPLLHQLSAARLYHPSSVPWDQIGLESTQ